MNLPKMLLLLGFIILINSCGEKKSALNLMNQAKNLAKQERYSEAAEKYQSILKQFPNDEVGAEATFELAKIYQGQVLKNIEPKESLRKSVELFKEISEKYPSSKYAEHSMFMAGFILANELNDIEKAKTAYNKYLEKYPHGELAKDARVELQNLGKTPEEVLKEKLGQVVEDETQK